MAHYSFLDENNIVTAVIPGQNEDTVVGGISDWEAYYGEKWGAVCKRTSFNTWGNQHKGPGEPFRYNYGEIGYTFDPTLGDDGGFIAPKPGPDWTLNRDTGLWEPPLE